MKTFLQIEVFEKVGEKESDADKKIFETNLFTVPDELPDLRVTSDILCDGVRPGMYFKYKKYSQASQVTTEYVQTID